MRLSVTTKIFLGLSVIVVTFGLVSIYALVQVHHIGRSLELTSRTYLPLTKLASQLETVQSHRTRDNNRLLEEREPRVRGVLISIARRHHPKLVQEQIALGKEIARSGGERASDPSDAEFLAEIGQRFENLEKDYQAYDRAADVLYRIIEGSETQSPSYGDLGSEGENAALDLGLLERRIEREIKDLGHALETKVTDRVRRTEAEESRVTLTILCLSLLAVLVAFAVILFAQRTLSPIRRLTEGVKHVRRGNYTQRVSVGGRDEIAGLAREFNAMAQALSEREAELVSKRTALLRAERLAAVGQMAAQISHEIRNPLSSVGLNAELLAEEMLCARFDEPERQNEVKVLLQAITAEVDRLTEITEEYLRFARMPRPRLEPEDINGIVQDVVAFVRGEMVASKVELVIDLEPNISPALADESQLRQALLNLIRNAREALEGRQGTVRIATSQQNDCLVISITDNGPGIPAQEQERIFDPFVSTKDGGTGLGLPLVHQIMADHGGSVSCRSEMQQGTTFLLSLKRSEPSPCEPADKQGGEMESRVSVRPSAASDSPVAVRTKERLG